MALAGNQWLVWTTLLGLAAASFWAQRTGIGKVVSGATVAIVLGLTLGNLRILPSDASQYEVVTDVLVPLAIPLLLLNADLRAVLRCGRRLCIAFLFGTAATVAGAVVAYLVVQVPQGLGPKLAGMYAATYIGGSLNFLAVARALRVDNTVFSAAVAADGTVGTLYMIFASYVAGSKLVARLLPESAEPAMQSDGSAPITSDAPRIDSVKLLGVTALSFAICACAYALGDLTHVRYVPILASTLLAVAIANLVRDPARLFQGSYDLGMMLMFVFFVVVGAGANIARLMRFGPALLAFAATVVTTHIVIMALLARPLGLSARQLVIGSCSNVSGPVASSAIAAARDWSDLVTPGILLGIVGKVIASSVALLLVGLLLR